MHALVSISLIYGHAVLVIGLEHPCYVSTECTRSNIKGRSPILLSTHVAGVLQLACTAARAKHIASLGVELESLGLFKQANP